MGAIALLAIVLVSLAAAATPSLTAAVLKQSQVGAGYVMKTRPDSFGVKGFVTMDMCGYHFRSEALRTGRLQVNYLRAGAKLNLSNEVVTYRPGGAAQAMREVRTAVATCPHTPVQGTVAGTGKLTYTMTHLKGATGLLPGAISLSATVSGIVAGKHRQSTTVVIYQVHGNLLSGVYAYGGTAATRAAFGLHAARASAVNLRRA